MRIEGRKAAVTGAGGLIGAAVCRRLAAEGAEVIGLEVDAAGAARAVAAGAEPRIADVADPDSTRAALADAELVVHTAAYVREWGSMEEFIRVNVRGTVNVLDAAERADAERVVHVSSVVVYGYDSPAEQEESAPRRSVGIPYIDTKSASDRIACRRGAVVVRPGDVYGPGSIPWVVRPIELMRARVFGLVRRDSIMLPIYVDDLAAAIVLAASKGRPGRTYTVWSGEPISFAEYFERLADLIGAPGPNRLPRPLAWLAGAGLEAIARVRGSSPAFGRHGAKLMDRRGRASAARAREELGWRPEVDLDEGLRRTAEWVRARDSGPAR